MKGKAAPEILYSDDRVLYPMRRTNPKTEPEPVWERITWDEALNEIASKLNTIKAEHGAEAIAVGVTTPSGTPFSDAFDWAHRFQYALGTPNNVSGTEVCNWHKDTAHAFTVGSSILYPDYNNADTIVLWGFNPSAVWLDQATQVAEARARGATIIAVDPRDAGYARDANHWLRVRPGMDGTLIMGIANIVISQGGYDDEFLTQWSNGPFLVSGSSGLFLRSRDLTDGEGDDYIALSRSGDLVRLPAKMEELTELPSDLALRGEVTVETIVGSVRCKTAFAYYADTAANYTLERTVQETGIEAEKIQAAADALMNANSVCYYGWTGIAQNCNASQIDRALATLMSMTGSYDRTGGNVAFTRHRTNSILGFDLLSQEQRDKALGLTERPLGPPAEAMITSKDFYTSVLDKKPYHIKAMFSFGANHIVSHGETDRAVEAYSSLEFFAHCNTVVTPTAKYADIFLPANTPWEREGLRVGFDISQEANELIQLRQAIVPSLGESRSDLEIMFELSKLLGFSDKFFDGEIDKAYAYILEPTGVTLEELRATPKGIRKPLSYQPKKYSSANGNGVNGFATDTGRIEIYSELLQRHGYSPVPAFTSPRRDTAKYPFTLTTAKSGYYTHSQFRNISSLRKRFPEPVVQVCKDAAEDLGFEAGDMVWIENRHGRIKMKLQIDNSLHPEVASASYGWWQGNTELGLPDYDPLNEKGANYNRLIVPDDIDPISGTVPHRQSECRLVAVNPVKRVKPAWPGFRPGSVSTLAKVADGVTRVGFKVEGMDKIPDYQPGQHITVRVTLPNSDQQVTRCYSLVGSAIDSNRSEYFISVRHVLPPPNALDAPDGLMSSFINQKLKHGAQVEIKAPGGQFILPSESDVPIVMIAGGIGITPFLSQLETVAATGSVPRVHLVYANRNGAVHAYGNRITELKEVIPSLTVVDIYNDPLPSDAEGSTHNKTGFVTADDILLPEFDCEPLIFQCGPPPMMAAVRSALEVCGYPADKIHEEAFASPASSVPIPDGPFTVNFAKSGISAEWTKDKGTLLQFGESLGIKLDSGCRAGQCESCAVGVKEGDYLPLLEVSLKEKHRCLICQVVPRGNITIDA